MQKINRILFIVVNYWYSISMRWKIIIIIVCIIQTIILNNYYRRNKIRYRQYLSSIILTGYILLVFASTIFSRPVQSKRKMILSIVNNFIFNLTHTIDSRIEILLNLFLLFPVGVLIPLCFKKNEWKKWQIFLLGCSLSLIIECTQYITMRGTFETIDIIENSIGALFGFMLLLFIKKL